MPRLYMYGDIFGGSKMTVHEIYGPRASDILSTDTPLAKILKSVVGLTCVTKYFSNIRVVI